MQTTDEDETVGKPVSESGSFVILTACTACGVTSVPPILYTYMKHVCTYINTLLKRL